MRYNMRKTKFVIYLTIAFLFESGGRSENFRRFYCASTLWDTNVRCPCVFTSNPQCTCHCPMRATMIFIINANFNKDIFLIMAILIFKYYSGYSSQKHARFKH